MTSVNLIIADAEEIFGGMTDANSGAAAMIFAVPGAGPFVPGISGAINLRAIATGIDLVVISRVSESEAMIDLMATRGSAIPEAISSVTGKTGLVMIFGNAPFAAKIVHSSACAANGGSCGFCIGPGSGIIAQPGLFL